MIDYFEEDANGQLVGDVVQNEQIEGMVDKALSMHEEKFADLTEEIDFRDTILSVRCIPFRDRLNRNLGTITVV